jgi:hypothetical protein
VILCNAIADGSSGDEEHDHLVPVNPYRGEKQRDYMDLLQIVLDLPDPVDKPTLMLVRPSFAPEECVELREKETDYEVVYTTVDRSVWYCIPDNANDGIGYKPRMRRLVSRLPKGVGKRVDALWNRILQDVRYAKIDGRLVAHVDGVIVEFWHGRRFGQTDDPNSGLPMLMTELGKELITLCKSDAGKRDEVSKVIEKKVLEIESYKSKD